MLGWLFKRIGWLPHRMQKWAEPGHGGVIIHHYARDQLLTPGEAKWLGAELILAGLKAERIARRQAESSCKTLDGERP